LNDAAIEPGPQEGASLNGAAAHHAAIAIDEPPRGGDGARRYLYSIDFLALRAAGAGGDGACAGSARAAEAAAAEAGRGDGPAAERGNEAEGRPAPGAASSAGEAAALTDWPAHAGVGLKGGTVEMIDPETATERGGRTPLVRRVSIVVVRDMILEQVHVEKRLREVGRPKRQLKLQSLFH